MSSIEEAERRLAAMRRRAVAAGAKQELDEVAITQAAERLVQTVDSGDTAVVRCHRRDVGAVAKAFLRQQEMLRQLHAAREQTLKLLRTVRRMFSDDSKRRSTKFRELTCRQIDRFFEFYRKEQEKEDGKVAKAAKAAKASEESEVES